MKKIFLITVITFLHTYMQAQTEKFDIASFIPPAGWQRIDSNGMLLFHNYRTDNGMTSFCQVFIFPSRASNNTPVKNFREEWNNRIAKTTGIKGIPATQTEKTPDGWTAVSGTSPVTYQGMTYTCILVTASGFGKAMSIMINLAGQEYMAQVESFLRSFEMDSKTTPFMSNVNTPVNFEWSHYAFTAPDKWLTHKTKDYILLSSSQTIEHGCLITILPPQPSSGNLEADAKNIFNQMYPGWQYRFTGEKHDDLSKGYTPQGLEYCMMEAPMHKMRPDGYYYDYEDGAVWVISLGKQIAIITGRHNRLIACFCNQQYNTWRRFFNSFTIKNQSVPKATEENISKRIVGSWKAMGGSALTNYIFAANGNYQFIGAYGTTTKISDYSYEYIHTRASTFQGDGSYSVNRNQLMIKGRGDKNTETVQFRFEKVNHGDKGWKERLYMLKKDVAGEYEVCYEKDN